MLSHVCVTTTAALRSPKRRCRGPSRQRGSRPALGGHASLVFPVPPRCCRLGLVFHAPPPGREPVLFSTVSRRPRLILDSPIEVPRGGSPNRISSMRESVHIAVLDEVHNLCTARRTFLRKPPPPLQRVTTVCYQFPQILLCHHQPPQRPLVDPQACHQSHSGHDDRQC